MGTLVKRKLLLDVVSGCQFAYHPWVKLRAAYTGPAMRIRRSSDNTEKDIGFIADRLDMTTLYSFLGGSTAYVTTLYDQSTNAFHLTQSTGASQPQLYIESNGYPSIYLYSTFLSCSIPTPSSIISNDLDFYTKFRTIQFDANGNESYSGIYPNTGVYQGIVHYQNIHVFFGGYDKFLTTTGTATDSISTDNIIPAFSNLIRINHRRFGTTIQSKANGAIINTATGTAGPLSYAANTYYYYGCDPATTTKNIYQRSGCQLTFNRKLSTIESNLVDTFVVNN